MLTAGQARNILASLEFDTATKDPLEYFNQGRVKSDSGYYSGASIAFLNALYLDQKNADYAYHLARSLYENRYKTWRTSRLTSSRDFLDYALELDSTHQQAKELLSVVNEEYERLKKGDPK